jgi:hypothetical protein
VDHEVRRSSAPDDQPLARWVQASEVMSAKAAKRRWSKRVMETSDALDLENGVFKASDPKRIARSLKRSAERSHRRKADPFRSAMSMLTFYINRAGKKLTPARLRVLGRAKDELRSMFGRSSVGQDR